ncbi:MAG: sugar transferase [Dolichospermum sp.]|nr:sugar transferase [Dolichospermum sp.]
MNINEVNSIDKNLNLPVLLDDISLPPELPPIVLLAFTRPDLLQEILPAIAKQTLLPRQILAFIDGPRNPKDQPLIDDSIKLLTEFSQIIPVKIINQQHNLGCDAHAIYALTEALSHYPAVIYLEDDTIPNPYFYDRMCRLLEAYRHCPQVCSITAYANFPNEIREMITADFMISRRVFAYGLGIWADRWQNLDLSNYPQAYNPFGHFYNIPATMQTKYTIVNQFFLEKENQKDWVITLTLAALNQGYIHITPMVSLVHNIGFGHPQAKTYNSGGEPTWGNAHSDVSACPNKLPPSLELIKALADPLDGVEFVRHLENCQGLWLSPSALCHLLCKYSGWHNRIALLKLFFSRLVMMMRRWRSGRPI